MSAGNENVLINTYIWYLVVNSRSFSPSQLCKLKWCVTGSEFRGVPRPEQLRAETRTRVVCYRVRWLP